MGRVVCDSKNILCKFNLSLIHLINVTNVSRQCEN